MVDRARFATLALALGLLTLAFGLLAGPAAADEEDHGARIRVRIDRIGVRATHRDRFAGGHAAVRLVGNGVPQFRCGGGLAAEAGTADGQRAAVLL